MTRRIQEYPVRIYKCASPGSSHLYLHCGARSRMCAACPLTRVSLSKTKKIGRIPTYLACFLLVLWSSLANVCGLPAHSRFPGQNEEHRTCTDLSRIFHTCITELARECVRLARSIAFPKAKQRISNVYRLISHFSHLCCGAHSNVYGYERSSNVHLNRVDITNTNKWILQASQQYLDLAATAIDGDCKQQQKHQLGLQAAGAARACQQ